MQKVPIRSGSIIFETAKNYSRMKNIKKEKNIKKKRVRFSGFKNSNELSRGFLLLSFTKILFVLRDSVWIYFSMSQTLLFQLLLESDVVDKCSLMS